LSPLLLNLLLLIGGIAVLYIGAEWLVRGAARMAASLGLSPIVVGLTVVSLGTSAPELAVCVLAAVRGDPDIAMGNVMGSNLANVGLILGLTALVRPLQVAGRVVAREVPLMLVATGLLYPLILDGRVGRLDGMILLVLMAFYLVFVFRSVEEEPPEVLGEYERFAMEAQHTATRLRPQDVLLVVAGSAGLVVGGTSIVGSAEYIAVEMGISQLVISLTIIAIGTSLPELATSLVAALRSEADIAVGNIIGSNIFNIGMILGLTSLVEPVQVNHQVLTAYLPAVLLMAIILVPVARAAFCIRRWEGAILLATYCVLMSWLIRIGVF
jgi:cation:H+ antiporter